MATTARFLVLWTTPRDPEAFDRHYREVHIPLANKTPGVRRYTVSRNASVARGAETYYLVAELDFDDLTALRTAFATPEGRAVAADVANLEATGATMHSVTFELEDVSG